MLSRSIIHEPSPELPDHMAVLLCTFASQRSSPVKIARWIAHLEEKLAVHRDDPEAARAIEYLLSKASRWT